VKRAENQPLAGRQVVEARGVHGPRVGADSRF
jgi:hypothetical protein